MLEVKTFILFYLLTCVNFSLGLHVNDAYNTPDEQGRVLINIGHHENEEDIFLAPQIARVIKPHQVCAKCC